MQITDFIDGSKEDRSLLNGITLIMEHHYHTNGYEYMEAKMRNDLNKTSKIKIFSENSEIQVYELIEVLNEEFAQMLEADDWGEPQINDFYRWLEEVTYWRTKDLEGSLVEHFVNTPQIKN